MKNYEPEIAFNNDISKKTLKSDWPSDTLYPNMKRSALNFKYFNMTIPMYIGSVYKSKTIWSNFETYDIIWK